MLSYRINLIVSNEKQADKNKNKHHNILYTIVGDQTENDRSTCISDLYGEFSKLRL